MLLQGKHALGETSFSGENILRRFVYFLGEKIGLQEIIDVGAMKLLLG